MATAPEIRAAPVTTERVTPSWLPIRRARLAARAPRYLATATLLVLCLAGLHSVLFPAANAAAPAPAPSGADTPSQDFALQFARAYLTYDAAQPSRRQRALAPFVSTDLAPGAGFTPASGSRRVLWADVASDQPALAGGQVITVAAAVSDQSAPLYLAVTVSHESGQPLSLTGYPTLVGAPAIDTAATPPTRVAVTEPAVTQVVERVLRNYLAASAPNLRADLTDDAQVTLPTIRLHLEEVIQTDWVAGPGSGAVLVTATASDAASNAYTLTYELGIAYRERPYVDFIEVVPTRS